MILPAIVLGALVLITTVHELGHLVAARLRGARVVRVVIGRGRRGFSFRPLGIECVITPFPIGGRVDYERPESPTADAVIAVGGPFANAVFGAALLWLTALAAGVPRMPFAGEATSAGDYAVIATSTWLRAPVRGVAELIVHGHAHAIGESMHALRRLLLASDPVGWVYVVAALSIVWATLNMIPIPLVRTDGWHVLAGLARAARGRGRGGS